MTASSSHALPARGGGSEPLHQQRGPGCDAALTPTVCEAQRRGPLTTDSGGSERCSPPGSVSGVKRCPEGRSAQRRCCPTDRTSYRRESRTRRGSCRRGKGEY